MKCFVPTLSRKTHPAQQVLFPEGPKVKLQPIPGMAMFRIGNQLLTRLGRAVLALEETDGCMLYTKGRHYFFAFYRRTPSDPRLVAVNHLQEAIVKFVNGRLRKIRARIGALRWSWKKATGYKLEILLLPL